MNKGISLKALMLSIAIMVGGLIYAQPPGGGQGGGKQGPPPLPSDDEIEAMVEDLSKELSLSSAQEDQVLDLYFEHFEIVESKTKAGRPERSEMEEIKSKFESDVNAVLTDDQKELYTAYLKKNKKQKGKR